MDNPSISIIIPIYNAEKLLKKCINSILDQTYNNWELLLLDDGSTDDSSNICKYYSQKDIRIKYYVHENRGVSYTRNRGITLSTSDYICFVDADDWVDKNYLKNFLPIPKGDFLCIQGITYEFPHRDKIDMFKYEDNIFSLTEEFTDYIGGSKLFLNGCPVAKLFKKDVLEKKNIRFDLNLNLNEDHLFVLNYYNEIHTVQTSQQNGYFYYYDYKLPSLTKKEHPAKDYLYASIKLNDSINNLLAKTGIKEENILSELYTTVGYNQLMKAILKSTSEKSCLKFLKQCIIQWRKFGKNTQYFKTNIFSYKVLALALRIKSVLFLFISAFFIYTYYVIKKKIFFFIKLRILKY